MEPNIYEDPGEYSATRSQVPTTVDPLPKQVEVRVEPPKITAPKATVDPFSCHFEETFRESAEPKVPEVIHHCYRLAYSTILRGFYILLSVLIGPILMALFAMILGFTSFMITWLISPIFRCCGMCFAVWESCISSCLDCFLAPFLRVLGSCCSRIVLRYQKIPSGEIFHV